MGALRSFFVDGCVCAHFLLQFLERGRIMNKKARLLAHGALIGALYVVLCHFQNLLLPNSATMAIQFRAAEALCVLAFFTPAAVPGLTVGCFLFNLTFAGALPTDVVVGPIASFMAAVSMRWLRKWPWLGMLMPAIWNAILVGWELTVYVGDGFWINALYVAIGEAAVLLTLGAALYGVMKRHLGSRLFDTVS